MKACHFFLCKYLQVEYWYSCVTGIFATRGLILFNLPILCVEYLPKISVMVNLWVLREKNIASGVDWLVELISEMIQLR